MRSVMDDLVRTTDLCCVGCVEAYPPRYRRGCPATWSARAPCSPAMRSSSLLPAAARAWSRWAARSGQRPPVRGREAYRVCSFGSTTVLVAAIIVLDIAPCYQAYLAVDVMLYVHSASEPYLMVIIRIQYSVRYSATSEFNRYQSCGGRTRTSAHHPDIQPPHREIAINHTSTR